MYRLFLYCFFVSSTSSLISAPLKVEVSAESAILMNAHTGAILYEKDPRSLHYPASITKVATAAYVLSETSVSLDERVVAQQDSIGSVSEDAKRRSNYTLPSYWLIPGASHIGIKRGEELSMRDLMYGMMLASGDDASNVIAQHIGGTIPDFMDQLNTYLVSLGCKNTHFNNPHGLFHPKHQTTALDMAILTREALKNPVFCEIVATTRYLRPKTNKQEQTMMVQTNRLLREGAHYYPKAIGVKTGFLSIAQNTLIAAAKSGDRVLIAVLLKVKDRPDMFKEAVALFETAFKEEQIKEVVLPAGNQEVVLNLAGASKPIHTYTKESIELEYYPAEEPDYKTVLVWDEVSLPIKKDQRVGELFIRTSQDETLQRTTLYAQHGSKASWGEWFSSFFR